MNILFFLTPKEEVTWINEGYSARQAMEKIEYHGYAAVPILTKDGKYLGTITEGDILWYLKNEGGMDLQRAEKIHIKDLKRRRDNRAVSIDTDMDDLVDAVKVQNFVPVTDDQGKFIGIVTRRDVIGFYYQEYKKKEQAE